MIVFILRQWYLILDKAVLPQVVSNSLCKNRASNPDHLHSEYSESPYTFFSDCSHDHTMPGLRRGHICKESGEEPEECRNVGVALSLLEKKSSLSLSQVSLSLSNNIYISISTYT